MERIFTFVCLLALFGCGTPHPAFFDSDKHVVEIEGSRFVIYEKHEAVEVYRTSFEYLPPLARIHARARVAIRQATGCNVVEGSLKGDQALMRALLDCGTGRKLPPPPEPDYLCEVYDPNDPGLIRCSPI